MIQALCGSERVLIIPAFAPGNASQIRRPLRSVMLILSIISVELNVKQLFFKVNTVFRSVLLSPVPKSILTPGIDMCIPSICVTICQKSDLFTR